MKRVLNFMRNPKLAHILVKIVSRKKKAFDFLIDYKDCFNVNLLLFSMMISILLHYVVSNS